jgi:hypothetical protein
LAPRASVNCTYTGTIPGRCAQVVLSWLCAQLADRLPCAHLAALPVYSALPLLTFKGSVAGPLGL